MANEDVIQIQRELADKYRAQSIAHQNRMKKDIRSQIAKAGHYNPDNDPPYVYVEYPKYVTVGGKQVVVHDADEELKVLGQQITAAKAVSVDLQQLAKAQEPEPIKAKRKYTRKAAAVELPAPLK